MVFEVDMVAGPEGLTVAHATGTYSIPPKRRWPSRRFVEGDGDRLAFGPFPGSRTGQHTRRDRGII